MSQTCPYCRDEITSDAESYVCPTCSTPHHEDCWKENGGCTVFGCASGPEDDPKVSLLPESQPPPLSHSAPPQVPPPIPPPIAPVPYYAPATDSANPRRTEYSPPPISNRGAVKRERPLLKDMLFMGFIGMPLGALAGTFLGLACGIIAMLSGHFGSLFSFPAHGLSYGQAFGAIIAIAAGIVRGRPLVETTRGRFQNFVRSVFGNSDAPFKNGRTDPPEDSHL